MKINLHKSEIIPLGRVDNVEELATELGCGVGSLPTKYLGLPLGAPHKASGVWDSIEERFRNRMSSWYGTGLWKDIRKEWLTFSQNSISSLGNGRRLGFWKDPWCNETVLCNEFPTLFNLVVHKDARVVDVWDSSREEGGWSPFFLRPFND